MKRISKKLSNRQQFFYFQKQIFIFPWTKNGPLDIGKNMLKGKRLTFSVGGWNLVVTEKSQSVLCIFMFLTVIGNWKNITQLHNSWTVKF